MNKYQIGKHRSIFLRTSVRTGFELTTPFVVHSVRVISAKVFDFVKNLERCFASDYQYILGVLPLVYFERNGNASEVFQSRLFHLPVLIRVVRNLLKIISSLRASKVK